MQNIDSFNQDLSQWDVGSVMRMEGAFMGAISFNQDLSQWDVSNVTDMFLTFHYAIVIIQSRFKSMEI